MTKLKPGPRPFLALGITCGLFYLLPLYVGLHTGNWAKAGEASLSMLILPAIYLGPICFLRVEVDDTEIRCKNFGIVWDRVRFEDIDHSTKVILAENYWPVSLSIHRKEPGSPSMLVRLKLLRKADVDWLLSLADVKIRA